MPANSSDHRCTWCHAPGHLEATCPYRRRRSSPYVPVKFGTGKHSPHVVELAKPRADWSAEVPVYHNHRASATKQVVDLAAIVREANQPKAQAAPEVSFNTDPVIPVKPRRAKQEWKQSLSLKKFALTTIALTLLVGLPYPTVGYVQKLKADANRVVEESTNAFLSLQSSTVAALHTDLPQAQHDLNAALESFGQAEQILEKEHRALVYVGSLLPVVGPQVRSRQHLLSAGHEVALGNAYLVKGIEAATATNTPYIVDRLAIMRNHIRGAVPQYQQALTELDQVDPATLPNEYQQSFKDFKQLYRSFTHDMQSLASVLGGLETMLGSNDLRRYLVLFQNNHEARPTGGFVGSFAVLDLQKGTIKNIDLPPGGTYDVKGQLDTYLKPPLPLQLINYRWEFQDGNWFPDFPASAQKMAWFYQHSRGTTVDGVIAINATVLGRVLKVLGPVDSQKFGVTVDADKGLAVLQDYVESGYDKSTNQPKAVLGDILGSLISSVQKISPAQILSLVTELNAALQQKEVQVYTRDAGVQAQWQQFGWTGEIAKPVSGQDYVMVVNTNVGGGKTDVRVRQTMEHEAAIQPDGSVIGTLIVRREHTGQPGEQYYGGDNINYVRAYVPAGAKLLDAGGFVYPAEESFLVPEKWYKDDVDLTTHEKELGVHVGSGTRITSEFGKTVFGNWVVTKAGETSEVWFKYKVPFKVLGPQKVNSAAADKLGNGEDVSRYSLLWQKQSGSKPEIHTQVIYPSGWRPVWRLNDKVELRANGAMFTAALETDQVMGVVMKRF